jgi:hypothetical protein
MWRYVDPRLTTVSEDRTAHVQGRKIREQVCNHLMTLFPRSRIFLRCTWTRYVPPERRLTQDLHSATSQNTTVFIITAVKTSNSTKNLKILLKKKLVKRLHFTVSM